MGRCKHGIDPDGWRGFVSAMAAITSEEEMASFLDAVLTPTEIADCSLRWRLLERLSERVPQRRIASELKVSLCKITRGSRMLKRSDILRRRLGEQRPAGCGDHAERVQDGESRPSRSE